MDAVIERLDVHDIRFPTSHGKHGSDAMHKSPDYSAAYVVIKTSSSMCGYGLTFTLGRGTELVTSSIRVLEHIVIGKHVGDVFHNFRHIWRDLTSEDQLRWLGPEKGVVHLAAAAIINALWDMWARIENKPLWKLLSDMDPAKLVSTIDFRYITDVLTPDEAVELLNGKFSKRAERENFLLTNGFPAYTTSVGWMGYSEEKVNNLCVTALNEGWIRFKVKVGADIEDDKKRCAMIRNVIGWDNTLMMDANQRWDVDEAIDNMKELSEFKPLWIEEPTSPDDILGHAKIAKALKPYKIGVATGEHCQNRVIFKQLLQAGAISYCQIDSCRVGGVNENLAIILMAAKFGVPICPHAGGVGLCEMVQHLSMFDYVAVAGTMEDRVVEFVDHLHEHFTDPVNIKHGCYQAPSKPGYSCEIKAETIKKFSFPNGAVWNEISQIR